MDRENSITVSEREKIKIEIRQKLGVFFVTITIVLIIQKTIFRCKMKRKLERKPFRCKNDKNEV